MTIGINLLFIIPSIVGGTETYCRNLIRELIKERTTEEFIFFLTADGYDTFKDLVNLREVIIVDNFRTKLGRIIYEQCIFPFKVYAHSIDILFSPGYVIPVLAKCKHVVTVHDMLYKRYPRTIPIMKRIYWGIFIPLSFWRSSKILAVSEFVRSEYNLFFPQYENKFVVTYESVNKKIFYNESTANAIQKKYNLADNYVVCVATLSPHKNLESVVTAVSMLKLRDVRVNVVFVGNKERSTKYLKAKIRLYGIEDQLYFTGFIPEDDLRAIYCNATVFVMPSLYEGFGLPILESMACGCPVVSSNAGSLPEVGGDAAEYFSPADVNELSEKIEKVYFNKRLQHELIQKGYSNVERYDWNTTARITLNAFESAYGN